ncbi:MAG TPA: hypothetical protein DCL08_09040, partial [Anaerolineaceae bacterium]|nr:hypothetical protein [Anaerolineaceae bacterium]
RGQGVGYYQIFMHACDYPCLSFVMRLLGARRDIIIAVNSVLVIIAHRKNKKFEVCFIGYIVQQ